VSTASAAFQPQASPSAPAVTETAKPEFAGGRSGGAGASGEFWRRWSRSGEEIV